MVNIGLVHDQGDLVAILWPLKRVDALTGQSSCC